MKLTDFFKRQIKPKANIVIAESELFPSIEANRKSLELVKNWIDDTALSASCFSYGVPDFIKADINKKINTEPTYSDYILHFAKKYFQEIKYFEIGVSVGKNFFQILNGAEKGTFTGFDIEEINPVLAELFNEKGKQEWGTQQGSFKKNNSSIRRFSFHDKIINYVSADVWDEKSWSMLKGSKYNLVFSDALHTPEAILFEFEMLVKYELLADQFIVIWDDLVGKMKDAFLAIIRKYDRVYRIKDAYLISVNGWIGQHERPHSVGIISNFEIK
jgi:hypothetical protein